MAAFTFDVILSLLIVAGGVLLGSIIVWLICYFARLALITGRGELDDQIKPKEKPSASTTVIKKKGD